MDLLDLLNPERVQVDLSPSSKKKLLERVAALLAGGDRGVEEPIFDALVARERTSPTGLGAGIAIPHGRVSLNIEPALVVVRLKAPLPYDAFDGQPVDLVFALVIPDHYTDEHLGLLAQIAALCADPEMPARLRAAPRPRALYEALEGWLETHT